MTNFTDEKIIKNQERVEKNRKLEETKKDLETILNYKVKAGRRIDGHKSIKCRFGICDFRFVGAMRTTTNTNYFVCARDGCKNIVEVYIQGAES